jgi:8-oxo-dGTP diphosphatase
MSGNYIVVPRVLCFVFSGDNLLFLKASKEKDWYGYVEPPGGHVEKGESVIDCAEKEILEETGLKVKNTRLVGVVHVSGFYNKEIIMFVTKSAAVGGKLVGSHEGEPIWISLKDLDKFNLLEDIKPITAKVVNMNNGEFFIGTSKFDGKDKLLSFEIKVQ